MFDVISIGSAIRDIFFEIEDGSIPICQYKEDKKNHLFSFHSGQKIESQKAYFSFGGGGSNSAVSFSRLGLKSALYSSLGKDGTADAIIENLKIEKVNTSIINHDKRLHTAMSFIIVSSSGERIIFPYAGASGDFKLTDNMTKKITQSEWIYLTTLREKAQGNLEKIKKLLNKNKNIKLAFNPGETELHHGLKKLSGILRRTNVLILNKEEAAYLASSGKKGNNKVDYLLKFLKKEGPEMVLITDGKNGAFLFDGKKIYSVTVPDIKTVDQTGAGDSFGSGFVAGLQIYGNNTSALKLAALNSLSVIGKFGAQEGLLKINQIKNINKNNKIKVKES